MGREYECEHDFERRKVLALERIAFELSGIQDWLSVIARHALGGLSKTEEQELLSTVHQATLKLVSTRQALEAALDAAGSNPT